MSDTTQPITHLPTSYLQPNPLQPRGSMDMADIGELVASIKSHGILEPVVVAHTPAGYQIIAGERRWKAAKLAGLTEVPCVVRETTPKGMLEMAIIENVQRVDLHPLDRAKAFKRLMDEFNLSVGHIADRVGKSTSYVSNSLRLLDLPDALKDGLLAGDITEGHARALSAIEDTKLMVEAYKILLKEKGSVRRAEDLARRMKAKAGQPLAKGTGTAHFLVSEEIDRWQSKMQQFFGARTQVKLQRSSQQTKVSLVFKGTPKDTQYFLDAIEQLAKDMPELRPPEAEEKKLTLESFQPIEVSV